MPASSSHLFPGVPLALGSAVLFGVTTPISKVLLGGLDPQLLAGLLYLGAGVGLVVVHLSRRAVGMDAPEAPLRIQDVPWLAAVVLFGGVLGPLLLMLGLGATSAASGSLLLNLEGLATMLIAWLAFARTWIAGCSRARWLYSQALWSCPGRATPSRLIEARC